jgi:phosphoserine phosphatase
MLRRLPAVGSRVVGRGLLPRSGSGVLHDARSLGVRAAASTGDALLIKVSGQDHPGITARLAEMLASSGTSFIDVDQVMVHDNLSLYFIVSMPKSGSEERAFIRNVLDKSKRENVSVDFEIVSASDVVSASAARVPQGLVVTLLKTGLGFKEIGAVTRTVSDAGFNISKIRRLSSLVPSNEDPASEGSSALPGAVELVVDPVGGARMGEEEASEKRVALRERLLGLRDQLSCDVALQRETLLRRSKRLVVLDMDATIIHMSGQSSVLEVAAERAGKAAEVAALRQAAERGEIDTDEAFRRACEHLKGLPISTVEDMYKEDIKLNPGASRFVSVCTRLGYQVAIISGSFEQVAEKVKAELGLDYVFANRLEVEEGAFNGKVSGAIVNRQRKQDLLESLCTTMGLAMEQVVAVGDSEDDLDMLTNAGLGIAFNANSDVQRQAVHKGLKRLNNTTRLDTVLYIMGITDSDVEALSVDTTFQLDMP